MIWILPFITIRNIITGFPVYTGLLNQTLLNQMLKQYIVLILTKWLIVLISNETKDYVNHYSEGDMTTGEHVTN